MAFLFADVFLQKVESTRVVLFYGQVGSYKTLSAVATARSLLATGRYARVYANMPVTFASSPPDNCADKDFDFLAEYARDSIFIMDEAGLFLSGQHKDIATMFAYPRHRNQVFLLCSKIETKNATNYADLFVHRDFNYSLMGLPIMSFRCGSWKQQKQPKHWVVFYSQYFRYYASKFDPTNVYPILQWRDNGVLYDERSRTVSRDIAKYFILNSWGQATKRKDLTEEENALVLEKLPEFEFDFENEKEFPKMKRKANFNPIGTEFSFGMFAKFLLVIYFMWVATAFVFSWTPGRPPLQHWDKRNWQEFLSGSPVTRKDEILKEVIFPEEQQPVEWVIE